MKGDLDDAFPRVGEVPFDSDRKCMTTLHRAPQAPEAVPASLLAVWQRDGSSQTSAPSYVAFVKGAMGRVLEISRNVWVEGRIEPLDESWQKRIEEAHDEMAAKGMRVLAVGVRAFEERPGDESVETLEKEKELTNLDRERLNECILEFFRGAV